MGSVKRIVLAGVAACIAIGHASAADLPPIIQQAPPVPVEPFGGWYLRGDIGMSNQRVGKLDNVLFAAANGLTWLDRGGFDSAPIFGVGVGYEFNRWFRADVTGEYRGKSTFHALDRYVDLALPGGFGTNDYTVRKHEWVALVNAYVDLGTWLCVTPFIGAGAGLANVNLTGFRDVNIPAGGVAYAGEGSNWNFAWALYAGLAYKVTPGFTVELAYRYLNMGDGATGDIIAYDGTNLVNNPMHFKDITSHDVKLGVRWSLEPGPVYMPPPLVRKG